MRGNRKAAALAALALLGGCSVGPDYHRSAPPAPAAWHQSLPPAAIQVSQDALTPRWWTLYNDPVLTELEEDVARSNLDLRMATARFDQSIAQRNIARAAQMPQMDGAASYMRERASPNGVMSLLGTTENQSSGTIASGAPGFGPTGISTGSGAFNLPQYGVSASWEVDLWGHVRRQVEVANASMRAQEDQRRDVLVSLMAETAQDYIALRAVQAQIGIVRQNLDIARRSMELTRARLEQGAATRLDTAGINGQYHGFEAQLPVLQSQEVHLLNALALLVAREPGALKDRLGPPRAIPPLPVVIPAGLPSQLAERRPDVRMAEERLHAATASIGVAISEFFPRLTLSGSLDIQALQFGDLGTWSSRQYGFGPTLTLPLFEGGKIKGQVRLRRAQQKEAAIALQRVMLKAWGEIDDAMADLSAAQTRRDRLAAAVAEDQIAVDVSQRQYAQGAGDFLHVLVLQNALLAHESQWVQATAEVSSAGAHLYRALGGGWEGV